MILNQPSPKELFQNNQAKLECIVTGQDRTLVNEMKITWQIDGSVVTSNITSAGSTDGKPRKTSTLTRSLSDWNRINRVSCSAARDNETPIVQDLTVQKSSMFHFDGDSLLKE